MRTFAALFARSRRPSVWAGSENATARELFASWKDDEPGMRAVAEVIASAFASGLSWRGSIAEKEIYCPPSGLNGPKIMIALAQFVEANPDSAGKPYGAVMAASLVRAFPCKP